jgi:hypothetical protein
MDKTCERPETLTPLRDLPQEIGIGRAIEAGAEYIQLDHLDVVMRMLRSRGLHKQTRRYVTPRVS